MPRILSRNFGALNYAPGEQFVFSEGLPGFPDETAFLPVQAPEQFPLLYLQSLQTPDLCFVTLPARCLVADYELSPESDALSLIGLGAEAQPGPEMLCLALLCFSEDGTASANLRAPLIVNVKNRMGVQMIQAEDRYPIRFPLKPEKGETVCS
jgi:flagellar assembly factor FliW